MNEDHAAMFQQQLQALLMQREQLNLQLLELRTAITELEKTAEKQVYKLAGPVLVKKPVEEVLADLKEKQELVTLRLQAIEKSETRTKERMQVLEKSPSKESAKLPPRTAKELFSFLAKAYTCPSRPGPASPPPSQSSRSATGPCS